jgi:hypothetical protein
VKRSEVKNEKNEVISGIFSCQNSQKQFQEKLQDFGTRFLVGSQIIERYVSLEFYFHISFKTKFG